MLKLLNIIRAFNVTRFTNIDIIFLTLTKNSNNKIDNF